MDGEDLIIKACETQIEFKASLALRLEVFCREQSFSEETEVDENDHPFPNTKVLHVIAMDKEKNVVGTIRMLKAEGYAKLGRMAVAKHARGHHIASRLVTQAESAVGGAWGSKQVKLSAQHQAEGFYTKCGYTCTGEKELDEGWPHVLMYKDL